MDNSNISVVQGILQEDLVSRGPKWTDLRAEIDEVGLENWEVDLHGFDGWGGERPLMLKFEQVFSEISWKE
jgi:hypothetical protein